MFARHRRAKAPNGWVGRVYVRRSTIIVYREGLLDSFPVDEKVLTYESKRVRRDVKRIVEGIGANVVDLTCGSLNLKPRPDRELHSPLDHEEEARTSRRYWFDVRQRESELRAKRLRGEA